MVQFRWGFEYYSGEDFGVNNYPMDNEIIDRLKQFLIKNKYIPESFWLSRNIEVGNDLGLFGENALKFIEVFGKEFNVDVSNFMAGEYVEHEGTHLFTGIFNRFFKVKLNSTKVLNIGDLEKAVIAGKLDESVLKFKKFESEYNGLTFKIEEYLADVGSYLYVYKGEKCTHDYLQNTILDCKEFAFEEFKVPMDSWMEIQS